MFWRGEWYRHELKKIYAVAQGHKRLDIPCERRYGAGIYVVLHHRVFIWRVEPGEQRFPIRGERQIGEYEIIFPMDLSRPRPYHSHDFQVVYRQPVARRIVPKSSQRAIRR